MTLEEAIKREKEAVTRNRTMQHFYENNPAIWNNSERIITNCRMFADEHEQFLQWLEKLRQIEQSYEELKGKTDSSVFPDDVLDFLSSLKRIE